MIYQVQIESSLMNADPYHWCCDTLGEASTANTRWGYKINGRYWFRRKIDYVEFMLRFG